MATLATLTVQLVGDTAQFQESMTKAEKSAEKFKKIGSNLQNTGVKLTAGVTAPLVAMGLVAVNAASDLEESLSKVNVVFGDNAAAIIEWSEGSATAMGQSQQQALEAVGTYGNLLQSIGVIPETAAEMSTSFVELASDLASFNNASPEETLLALRSALTGEFEPMKRFGVALSQAAVAQRALDMGLIETTADLTPAIKAQAGYALIMEQTTLAQGDFALTSEGLANKTRIVKSQFIDTAAAIGQQLLPVALQLVSIVQGWIERFQGLSPHMQKVILIVAGIAAAIGPLLMIIGTLVSTIGTIFPVVTAVVGVLSGPLLLIIGAVIAVITLLALAWRNNWGGIQEKTQAVVEWLKSFIGAALVYIQDFWTAHGAGIIATVTQLWEGIKSVINSVITIVITIVQAALQFIMEIWNEHGTAITAYIEALWNTIVTVFQGAITIIQNVFAAFAALLTGDWEALGVSLQTIWETLWGIIESIFNTAKLALETAFGILKTVLGNIWEHLKTALTATWDALWAVVNTAFETAKATLETAFDNIKTALETTWEDLKDSLITIIEDAWTAIQGIFETAWTTITSIADGIVESIIGAFEIDWGAVGTSIIDGIKNAINDGIPRLIRAAKNAARDAYNAFLKKLGIGSPSRLMFEVGLQTIEGFALGLEQTSRLERAIEGFAIPFRNLAPLEMDLRSFAGDTTPTISSATSEGTTTSAPIIIYGGLHLHGIEDAESMSDKLMELRT